MIPSKFGAFLICLVFLIAFYGLFYAGLNLAFGREFLASSFKKKRLGFLLLFFFCELLLGTYKVSTFNSVYTFDSAGYWTWSYTHMQTLFASPEQGLANLWDSIINTDYNLVLPTVIALPLKVFGVSFSRYVLINYCLFVIPASFIFLCLFKSLFGSTAKREPLGWFFAFCIPFASFFTRSMPAFQGYIDVAILIPILLIISIMLKYRVTSKLKKNLSRNILLSILLCATFLFRRYTAFFIIGFFISLLITALFEVLISKESSRKKKLLNAFLNLSFVGLASLFIIIVFFRNLVFRILKEDYSLLYSAYSDTLGSELLSLLSRFSIPLVLVALIGVVYAFTRRRNRRIVLFSTSNILVTTLLFLTIQRMDGHHTLILIPQLLVLIIVGSKAIFLIKKPLLKRFCLFSLFLFCAFQIPYCYLLSLVIKQPISYLFVQKSSSFTRGDMSTLHDIKNYINQINSSNSTVYLLSSSTTFNYGTLANLEKPYNELAVNNLALTYDVDLRDGFPDPLMIADYIIVPSPSQTHLKEGSQEIVRWFSELIEDDKSFFGRHFKKLEKSFVIDGGITVSIYTKISDFSKDDYEKILNYFSNLYPEATSIFEERIKTYF